MITIENKTVISGSFTLPTEEIAVMYTITFEGDMAHLKCAEGNVSIPQSELAKAMILAGNIGEGLVKVVKNYDEDAPTTMEEVWAKCEQEDVEAYNATFTEEQHKAGTEALSKQFPWGNP